MARVDIRLFRTQYAHFGLYRTSAGGDESIIVRRKVGEPTDYMHPTSKALKSLRHHFALASQHYSHLTPSQKAITKHQIEEVEYQKSHGKTDTKFLMGRQLFISRELRSLETTGKQLALPHELCIILSDQGLCPLDGELWLRYLKDDKWRDCSKEQLATGSWLFSKVPPKQEAYRVYGEADGFFDPQLPEHQFMTEQQILPYHYHKLLVSVPPRTISFYSSYWAFSAAITSHVSATTIHIHSELNIPNAIGDLTIGLQNYVGPIPPEDWIAKRTYPLSPADPDPKHFYTTFTGLNLIEGTKYRISEQIPGRGYEPWWGYIYYYLIP